MTWIRPTLVALAAAFALTASPVVGQGSFLPQTRPLVLDPTNPDDTVIGELTFRGGLEIEPGKEDIGGITAIKWSDGQLHAVTSDGRWLIMTPSGFRDTLSDVVEIEYGPLLDERGKRLKGKDGNDARSLTRDPMGGWLVDFGGAGIARGYPSFLDAAMPVAGDPEAPPPFPLEELQASLVSYDCAASGVCFALLKGNAPSGSLSIEAMGPDGFHETLAVWDAPPAGADFIGLAVRAEAARTFLYLVSDNGLADDSNTVLLKFMVSARAASAPGVPEKVFETTKLVLETTMGEITVSLETERAPITVANFLRYVDEDRYDGTKCYRAMHVAGGEQPAGFLQCGTQNHPDRILDPIAHEPTNETGLNHTDGALSMARFDPGTATGDFSIMIRNQPGLDAQPDAEDPALRPGFAVFGYVIDGMDVVHAIHAMRRDPDKGEGFLKGQMLAEPVTIVDIRWLEDD